MDFVASGGVGTPRSAPQTENNNWDELPLCGGSGAGHCWRIAPRRQEQSRSHQLTLKDVYIFFLQRIWLTYVLFLTKQFCVPNSEGK